MDNNQSAADAVSSPIYFTSMDSWFRSRLTRRSVAAAIGALVLAGTSVGAIAATYEVSPSGNDANSGAPGSPWKTIQKAANFVSPGDTVQIGAGTYKERIAFNRSGAANAPVTFRAVAGAVVDGTGFPGSSTGTQMLDISNVSYLTIDGLAIKNSPGWGIYLGGSATHIELTGLDVSASAASGVFITPSTPNRSYSIVRKSKVHDNAGGGIVVWLAPGGYFLIEDNQSYNNAGAGNYDGIQVGGGDGSSNHVVVRRNVAYGNGQGNDGADQIDLGGHAIGDHFLVEENDARGPGGVMKVHQAWGGIGIIARRNRLSGIGFAVYGFPTPAVYYNNTIVDAAGHALQIFDDRADPAPGRSLGGFDFRNNLVLQSSNYLFLLNGVAGYNIDVRYPSLVFATNMYKFTAKGIGWSPRIFDAQNPDPAGALEFAAYQAANPPFLQDIGSKRITSALTSVFVNPTARDYHLAAGSPAIDAGGPLTKATGAGTNAMVIPVVRSDYFQDGYGGLIQADTVKVGGNAPVKVVAVDEAAKTVTVATPISWSSGDPVTLPYNGSAPDVGAYESGSELPSPTLLSVEPVS